MIDLEKIEGFDWDKGNSGKNWRGHKVSDSECEEVFFNQPLLLDADMEHSSDFEKRYYVLGKSNGDRRLFIAMTVRKNLIRVISARDMTRVEKEIYENL